MSNYRTRRQREDRAFFGIALSAFLIGCVFYAAIIVVAVHFIAKWW